MTHEAVSSNKKYLKTWFKAMILLAVMLTSGYFIYQALLSMQAQQGQTQLKLQWQAPHHLTATEAVVQSTTTLLKQPLLKIAPEALQQKLLALPWIKQAHIQKQWPRHLQVTITEHKPIARFNQTHWLTTDGAVIQAPNVSALHDLPEFYGTTKDVDALLTFFQAIQAPLQDIHQKIHKLTLDHRHAWQLQLNNKLKLYFGRQKKSRKNQKIY